jgi:hypothetical protein
MKTIVKLILAGTALAGASGAGAATITNLPTAAGGSDLVLFVTDTANNQYFVQDLGVSVSSLGVTTASVNADNAAGNQYNVDGLDTIGTLNNPIGANGLDTALATFLNANVGGTFTYGILGAQVGDGSTGVGQAMAVASLTGPPTTTGSSNIAKLYNNDPQSSDAVALSQTDNAFFQATNSGNAGGTPYGSATSNGAQVAGTLGFPSNHALGTAVYLYDIVSMGASEDANVYGSSTAITVSSTGVISGFAGSPVPIPAAVWLLGSGLIGLFGIGGRRANRAV